MFSAPKRKSSSTTLSGPRHSIKNEASTEAPSDLAVPGSPTHIRMDDGDRGQEGTDDDVEGDQSSSAAAKRKMPAGAVGRGRGSGGRGRGRGGRGGRVSGGRQTQEDVSIREDTLLFSACTKGRGRQTTTMSSRRRQKKPKKRPVT